MYIAQYKFSTVNNLYSLYFVHYSTLSMHSTSELHTESCYKQFIDPPMQLNTSIFEQCNTTFTAKICHY